MRKDGKKNNKIFKNKNDAAKSMKVNLRPNQEHIEKLPDVNHNRS